MQFIKNSGFYYMPGTNGTYYQSAIQSQLENKNLVKIANSILNLIPSVLSHADDLSKKILKEMNDQHSIVEKSWTLDT